jgi:hypothetical protein
VDVQFKDRSPAGHVARLTNELAKVGLFPLANPIIENLGIESVEGLRAKTFDELEEWLEAFLLIEDASVQRVIYSIPIAHPLALEETPGDWSRIKHLLLMRLGRGFELG